MFSLSVKSSEMNKHILFFFFTCDRKRQRSGKEPVGDVMQESIPKVSATCLFHFPWHLVFILPKTHAGSISSNRQEPDRPSSGETCEVFQVSSALTFYDSIYISFYLYFFTPPLPTLFAGFERRGHSALLPSLFTASLSECVFEGSLPGDMM